MKLVISYKCQFCNEMLLQIVDMTTDYETLKNLASTNKLLRSYVKKRFDREADFAIAHLGLPEDTNKKDLIEKLYYLNNDRNADPTGITIYNRDDYKGMKKGNRRIVKRRIDHLTYELWMSNWKNHRIGAPSVIARNQKGNIVEKIWSINGIESKRLLARV